MIVPGLIDGDGPQALAYPATASGKVSSPEVGLQLPARSPIEGVDQGQELEHQEVVIGGWRRGEADDPTASAHCCAESRTMADSPSSAGWEPASPRRNSTSSKTVLAPLRTDASPFSPPLSQAEPRR